MFDSAGTCLSTSSKVWPPCFWMSCWPTVTRLAPTGATPRMLVPVTVTSSTGALGACARLGDSIATVMRARLEPPSLSCRVRLFMAVFPCYCFFLLISALIFQRQASDDLTLDRKLGPQPFECQNDSWYSLSTDERR